MKGASFQSSIEYHLQVEGESWRQGETISGTLSVKNHGSVAIPLSEVSIHLALGNLRKVRARAADAFEVVSSASFSAGEVLEPGRDASLPWVFKTARDLPISDNSESPFLIYGRGKALETYGQLQLPVHPDPVIEEFLKILQIQFRFVQKTQKFSKNSVEVKLAPPSAKAFATLEQLVMGFRLENDVLEVRYNFHLKKLEASASSYELKKEKNEIVQKIPPQQYLLASGRVNHDWLERQIREALKTTESKIVF